MGFSNWGIERLIKSGFDSGFLFVIMVRIVESQRTKCDPTRARANPFVDAPDLCGASSGVDERGTARACRSLSFEHRHIYSVHAPSIPCSTVVAYQAAVAPATLSSSSSVRPEISHLHRHSRVSPTTRVGREHVEPFRLHSWGCGGDEP